MIRLIITASALSLAAAKTPKSTKVIVSPTPPPAPLAKSVKSAKLYASVSMSTSMSLTPKSAKLTTKSAKLSKSSKSGNNLIASFGCPRKCISAQEVELSTDKLENAVTTCDASDEYQTWNVHEVGGFLKIESAAHNDGGMCLAIIGGCAAGEVGLAHCDAEESNWYFMGSNLASHYCWEHQGTSTVLSVDGCTAGSSNVVAKDVGAVSPSTTLEEFMFLNAGD